MDNISWLQAVRGNISEITQAVRPRPFTYTFDLTYPASNPPSISPASSSNDLLSWLRAETAFDADVSENGLHTVES